MTPKKNFSPFVNYLLSIERTEAIYHVIDCLKSGGELAWDFMSNYVGEKWSCEPEQLPFVINGALNKASMVTHD